MLSNIVKIYCFEDKVNNYNDSDINRFISSVKNINQTLNEIKLLLISPNTQPIRHESVINVFHNNHSTDPYCIGKEINDLFVDSLMKIGFNLSDISSTRFSDKSEI